MTRQRSAVTAIGADRPGIVSAISGALFGLGCNLAGRHLDHLARALLDHLDCEGGPIGERPDVEGALGSVADDLGLM